MSLAFVRGIHMWPLNSPHKGPLMLKKFPFDDVIMDTGATLWLLQCQWRDPINNSKIFHNQTTKCKPHPIIPAYTVTIMSPHYHKQKTATKI